MDQAEKDHLEYKEKTWKKIQDNVGRNLMRQIERERLDEMVRKTGAAPRKHEDVYIAYSLPAGASWEDLRVKFFDGHTVKVKYKELPTKTFSYKEMGFSNDKSHKPNIQWEFLREIADHHGYLTVSNYNKRFHKNTKYELVKVLKAFFGMEEDPFERYTKNNGYRLRFVLLSESDTHPLED